MQDLDASERLTRPGGNAVVVGGGLIGIELVECLLFHRMNVTFLVREPWYWPMALGAEEGGMISDHIRRHGVNLLLEEAVAEVHSENGRVTGVSTESGKHFDCEIFGVTAGVRPGVDWLKGVRTPPKLERGVVTGPDFSTSLTGVWAAGDVAEIHRPGERPRVEQIWYSAKRQGELAGRAMLGDPVDYRPPLFYNSSKFFEIEFTTVGETVRPRKENPLACCNPVGATSFFHRIPGKEACMRLVERDGAVIGFNMLGSRWNHTFFERWIEERRSLDHVMEHLHEAQFDVEFGRQDLSSARAGYEQWKNSVGNASAAGKVLEEV
jgi:NADPH-dependent 2,4-dienoyl-CoA reductase/sulfur reductase-like enzyme